MSFYACCGVVATSFNRSQLQPLFPLLGTIPTELYTVVPYLLSFIMGNSHAQHCFLSQVFYDWRFLCPFLLLCLPLQIEISTLTVLPAALLSLFYSSSHNSPIKTREVTNSTALQEPSVCLLWTITSSRPLTWWQLCNATENRGNNWMKEGHWYL